MRILFVTHAWHPEGRGGTELHAHAAARALSLRGHQLGVFTRTGRPELADFKVVTEWQGKTSVTRINNLFMSSDSLEWIYKNERIHEAFVAELREFKPDLVHIHHLVGLSTTLIEAAKAEEVPVVMTLHDFWTFCPRGQRMQRGQKLCEDIDRNNCYSCLSGLWPHLFGDRESERTIVDVRGRLSPGNLAEWDRNMTYALGLCDLLICPSEFHRERMLDYPLPADRIVALPHGLDHGPFAGRERSPDAPVRRIGYIGSIIPPKGAHVLVEAFKKLDRDDLSLHLYGDIPEFHDDLTYGDRLHAAVADRDDVVFHGGYEPDQVARILEDIDVLVVPSLWWETFCLTIREGLLAGIPVIASDHGAMREALDGEEDGIFFRVGDVDDLVAKLEHLLDDREYRAAFYNRAQSVKTLEVYIEELEQLYSRAIATSRERQPDLVVAPPSFPKANRSTPPSRRPAESAPWENVDVTLKQSGPLRLSVTTKKPSADDPALGLDIRLTDGAGSEDLGGLDVEVDLGALRRHLEDVQEWQEREPPAKSPAPSRAPADPEPPAPEPEAAEPAAAPVRPRRSTSSADPAASVHRESVGRRGAVRKVTVGGESSTHRVDVEGDHRVSRERVERKPLQRKRGS